MNPVSILLSIPGAMLVMFLYLIAFGAVMLLVRFLRRDQ